MSGIWKAIGVITLAMSLTAVACGDTGGTADPDAAPATSDAESAASEGTTTPTPVEAATTTLPAEPEAADLPPASIDIDVEEGASATQVIGSAGGSLEATGSDGTVFALTVPPGAVLRDTSITMTPIADASGDAIGDAVLAGVQLEPDGLNLLRMAVLEISGTAIEGEVVGFSTEADGVDFHLVPISPSGGLTVATTHFSGGGVVGAEVAELMKRYGSSDDQGQSEGALAELEPDAATTAFRVWAAAIALELELASGRNALEAGTAHLFAYISRLEEAIEQYSWPQGHAGLLELGQGLVEGWYLKINADVDRLNGLCSEGNPDAGFRVVRWMLLGGGLEDRFGVDLDLEHWGQVFEDCLRFSVKWDVTVGFTAAAGSSSVTAIATAPTSLELLSIFGNEVLPQVRATEVADFIVGEVDLPLPNCDIDNEAGKVTLQLRAGLDMPNPGGGLATVRDAEITAMAVFAGTDEPVRITCRQDPNKADHAFTFFGDPLELVNISRNSNDGYAGFELEVVRNAEVFAKGETTDVETINETTATVTQQITVVHSPQG